MSTQELELIVSLFSKVTDGAMVGGVTYLVLSFIQGMTPWLVGGLILNNLIGKLPKIKKKED